MTDRDALCVRLSFLLLSLALICLPQAAWAKWYLLASGLPNTLYVIDTETDKIAKEIAFAQYCPESGPPPVRLCHHQPGPGRGDGRLG